jgi:hypothetical protein
MLDFELLLSRTLSRKEIDFFVEAVYDRPHRFGELLQLLLNENQQLAWHAAWVVQKLFEKYPELFSRQTLQYLSPIAVSTEREGIRRLLLSIVVQSFSPEEVSVEMVNHCFKWMHSPASSIAVQVLSIHYLRKVCQCEPELLPELQLCVLQLSETTDSPAIRSVAKKVLRD